MTKTEARKALEDKKQRILDRKATLEAKVVTLDETIADLLETREAKQEDVNHLAQNRLVKAERYLAELDGMDCIGDSIKDCPRLRNIRSFLRLDQQA